MGARTQPRAAASIIQIRPLRPKPASTDKTSEHGFTLPSARAADRRRAAPPRTSRASRCSQLPSYCAASSRFYPPTRATSSFRSPKERTASQEAEGTPNRFRVHSRARRVRLIPEISALPLPAARASSKRSGNLCKFRGRPTDISAPQPQPSRRDTRSRSSGSA